MVEHQDHPAAGPQHAEDFSTPPSLCPACGAEPPSSRRSRRSYRRMAGVSALPTTNRPGRPISAKRAPAKADGCLGQIDTVRVRAGRRVAAEHVAVAAADIEHLPLANAAYSWSRAENASLSLASLQHDRNTGNTRE